MKQPKFFPYVFNSHVQTYLCSNILGFVSPLIHVTEHAPQTFFFLLVIMLLSNKFHRFSTHLEENSTMASLEGERLNTIIMKCSSDSTQKVMNVQDYGAKGDVASDFMVFTRLSSPSQISVEESLLIIHSIHSVGTQEQTLSPQACYLLKTPANLKSWGHSKRRGTKRIGVAGTPGIGYSSVISKTSLFEVVEPSMAMGRYGGVAPVRKALSFNSCKNSRVENLKVMDSPRMHISLEKRTGVDASHPSITTPDEIPNTDGIHVTHSKRVKIANSLNLCA
ncbi:unnamed protein product [Musa acuminata subsp. burmannicoides]